MIASDHIPISSLNTSWPPYFSPQLETARSADRRPTYEQRRKVVDDAGEKRSIALIQQAHAVLNEKTAMRREANSKRLKYAWMDAIANFLCHNQSTVP